MTADESVGRPDIAVGRLTDVCVQVVPPAVSVGPVAEPLERMTDTVGRMTVRGQSIAAFATISVQSVVAPLVPI